MSSVEKPNVLIACHDISKHGAVEVTYFKERLDPARVWYVTNKEADESTKREYPDRQFSWDELNNSIPHDGFFDIIWCQMCPVAVINDQFKIIRDLCTTSGLSHDGIIVIPLAEEFTTKRAVKEHIVETFSRYLSSSDDRRGDWGLVEIPWAEFLALFRVVVYNPKKGANNYVENADGSIVRIPRMSVLLVVNSMERIRELLQRHPDLPLTIHSLARQNTSTFLGGGGGGGGGGGAGGATKRLSKKIDRTEKQRYKKRGMKPRRTRRGRPRRLRGGGTAKNSERKRRKREYYVPTDIFKFVQYGERSPESPAQEPREESPSAAVSSPRDTSFLDYAMVVAFKHKQDAFYRWFDGFQNFQHTTNVSALSANGINAFLLYYTLSKEDVTAFLVLKSAKETHKKIDNIFYEYVVGKYFLNPMAKRFPVFVHTHGLLRYRSYGRKRDFEGEVHRNLPTVLDMSKFVNGSALIYLESANNRRQGDVLAREIESSCSGDGVYLHALLSEFVPSSQMLSEYLSSSHSYRNPCSHEDVGFVCNDLPAILFIIYSTLHQLRGLYSHRDLKMENVLLCAPYKMEKYFTYVYYLSDGTTVTFDSMYVPKIIDYARNFFQLPATDGDLDAVPTFARSTIDFAQVLNTIPNCFLDRAGYNVVQEISEGGYGDGGDLLLLYLVQDCFGNHNRDYYYPWMDPLFVAEILEKQINTMKTVTDAYGALLSYIQDSQTRVPQSPRWTLYRTHGGMTCAGEVRIYLDDSGRNMDFFPTSS